MPASCGVGYVRDSQCLALNFAPKYPTYRAAYPGTRCYTYKRFCTNVLFLCQSSWKDACGWHCPSVRLCVHPPVLSITFYLPRISLQTADRIDIKLGQWAHHGTHHAWWSFILQYKIHAVRMLALEQHNLKIIIFKLISKISRAFHVKLPTDKCQKRPHWWIVYIG